MNSNCLSSKRIMPSWLSKPLNNPELMSITWLDSLTANTSNAANTPLNGA